MKLYKSVLIILLAGVWSLKANAQVDATIKLCENHLKLPFISDGQSYTAFLNGDEVAEFYATFYGQNTYRMVTATGTSEGNVVFSVYDKQRNLLFSNIDYQNTPYWDFTFENSLDCIIEARLDSKVLSSGFVVLLIGFKQ
jgi:hypothetical protein